MGAYGIANRVAFIFVMVTMGVNQGMQPIAGYNYGAQKFDRLLRVLKLAMISATCVTTSGFLVAEFCPRLCVSLFTDDAQLTSLSINGLRILMAAMPIVGYQMVITNFFQSIGMAKISIFLSLSRQLNPENYFDGCFGIMRMEEEPIEKVRIRVFYPEYNYIEEVPLHDSQEKVGEYADGAYREYTLRVRPTRDFLQELLWHGRNIMVLKPENLRQKMIAILKDMTKSYETGECLNGE